MHITISGLAEFFTNAPKALLVRRLGLYLGLGTDEFVESESFTFDTLDQYKLNSEIMNSLQKGVGRDDHFNLVRASGLLPHSTPGILTYDRSYQQVKGFYGKFSHLLQNREGAVEIDLDIEGFKLSGMGDNIYDGRNIFFRYASAKSSDILSAWITHLALCATGVFRGDTLLVSKNGFRRWEYMHDSDGILSSLLEIYKDGMIRPLPVFPLSTMKFAETFFDGKKGEPRARALKEAYTAFHGGRFSGDTADPYVAKLFGGPYNLSDDFIDLALKIYTPVYENMKNGEAL
jgi:exodeoxyribonuclease V gamma subunit